MAALELFHRIAEPASAAARRLVRERGLLGRIAFRNVAFPSHRGALTELGGRRTPALWDGSRLHEGIDAIRVALASVTARR